MKTQPKTSSHGQSDYLFLAISILLWLLPVVSIHAQNGRWFANNTNGYWSDATRWTNGVVADGIDNEAAFWPAATPTTDVVFTNDADHVIGRLILEGSRSYIINTSAPASLTLQVSSGKPIVAVSNNVARVLRLNLPVLGTQGLLKLGIGRLSFGNAGNAYGGDTVISNGTIQTETSNVIPDGPGKGDVYVWGATNGFRLNGGSETINGLWGDGPVANVSSTTARTLTIGNNDATSTYSGTMTNAAAVLNIVKIGSGTLSLTASNGHTGSTTVDSNGVLRISHPNCLGAITNATTIKGSTLSNRLELVGSVVFAAEPLIIESRQTTNNSPSLLSVSGNNEWTGVIALSSAGGGPRYNIRSDSGYFKISGPITNSFAATGTRELVLMGAGDGEVTNFLGGASGVSDFYNIRKEGSGTWTMTGSMTNKGTMTVNGGRLALASTASILPVTSFIVSSNGTLDVSSVAGGLIVASNIQVRGFGGNFAGNVTMNGGAVMQPGTFAAAGTLTFSNNLTLNGGVQINIDLANNTTAGGGINDLIDVKGAFNIAGTVIVELNPLNGPLVAGVPYTLFRYGTKSGSGTLQIRSHFNPVINDTGSEIQVTFSGSGGVDWRGNGTVHVWDVNSSSNWWTGSALDVFYNGDLAQFNSTGSNTPSITVTSTIYPSSVVVDNPTNYNYIFIGTGNLSGSMNLTKNGDGILSVSNANTYTGNTIINGGIYRVGNTNALGSSNGPTVINVGGTLDANSINTGNETFVLNGGTIINNGAAQNNTMQFLLVTNDSYVGGINRWDVRGNAAYLSVASGVTLYKNDANQVSVVTGSLTNDGVIRVNAGIFNIENLGTKVYGTGSIYVDTNAILQFYQTSPGLTLPLPVTLNGAQILSINAGGVLGTNPTVITGTITVLSNSIFGVRSNLWVGGPITGAGSLSVTGYNTLVLAGDNTLTGNMAVDTGVTLIISNTASLGLGTNLVLANGTTVNVTNRTDGTLTVSAGQTLSAGCNLTGNLTVQNDAWLSVGSRLQAGTLSVSTDLSIGDNDTIFLDLANITNAGASDMIIASNLNLGNNITINFSFLNGTPVTDTPYTIIRYTGTLNGDPLASFSGISSSRYTYQFDTSVSGEIRVIISGSSGNLLWRGNGTNNRWDITGTKTWMNGPTLDFFYDGDTVLFDDTGSNTPPVNLLGAPSPGAITFTATKNYTFSGSGGLSGGAPLVKNGSGTLIIANSNNAYFGPVALNVGTLQIGDNLTPGSLGTARITNGTTVLFNCNTDMVNTAILDGSGLYEKKGTGATTIASSNTFTGPFQITDGVLKVGNMFAFGDTNTPTYVTNNGTLDINNQVTVGFEPVVISGSGFNGQGVLINSGAALQYQAFRSVTMAADATVGGPMRFDVRTTNIITPNFFNGNNFRLTKIGTNCFGIINQSNYLADTALGDIDIKEGIFTMEASVTMGNPTNTMIVRSNAAYRFWNNAGGITNLFNKAITMEDGSCLYINAGTATFVGTVTLASGIGVLEAKSGTALYLSNTISGPGMLVKGAGYHPALEVTATSPGDIFLYGTNTYSGGTLITNSYLRVGAHSLGSGDVTVADSGGLVFQQLTDGVCSNNVTGNGALITSSSMVTNIIYIYGLVSSNVGVSANGGHMALMRNNTFTGGATNMNGSILVAADNALGAVTAPTYINGAGSLGSLQFTNNVTVAEPLVIYARSASNPQLVNVSGVNTLTGDITITGTAGTLYQFRSDAGRLVIQTNLMLTEGNSRLLYLQGAGDGEIQGHIGGNASWTLFKEGPGRWTISGNNTYSNNTYVSGGTLALAAGATIANTPVIVLDNGSVLDASAAASLILGSTSTREVRGTGAVAGVVIANPSTILNLGSNRVTGTLVFSNNLVMNGQVTNLFDLASANTPGGGTNDLLTVLGQLTATGTNYIVLNNLDSTMSGTYRLINYSSFNCGTTNFAIVYEDTRQTFQLVLTPSGLDLVITGTPASLTWKGDGTANVWDNGTTINWLDGSTPTFFKALDSVSFTDTGFSTPAISIAAQLKPALVTVNSTNNYTLNGGGSLAGGMDFIKANTGTVTLTTSNSYSGNTLVNGGTLVTSNANALGTIEGGTVVAAGATLDVKGFDLGDEAITAAGAGVNGAGAIVNTGADQLDALRYVTLTGDTTFGGAGRWDIRGPANALTATLSTGGQGYKLTKVGTGWLSLVNVVVDSALGDIDVQAGTFGIDSNTISMGNPTKSILVASNAAVSFFNTSNAFDKHFLFADGATNRVGGGTAIIVGPLTLNGNVAFNSQGNTMQLYGSVGGSGSLLKSGAGNLFLRSAATLGGNVTIFEGRLILDTNSSLIIPGNLTAATNGTLVMSNLSRLVCATAILNRSTNQFLMRDAAYLITTNITMAVTNGVMSETSYIAASSLSLLNGTRLSLNGYAALSNLASLDMETNTVLSVIGRTNSTLALNPNQTLSGSGTIMGGVSDAVGVKIQPGGSFAAGTLTVSNTLSLDNGATLTFDLANNVALGGGTNDYLVVSNLAMSATTPIVINFLTGVPAVGTYTIIRYNGTRTGAGAFSLVNNSRYLVNLDETVTNQIRLVVSGGTPGALTWVGDSSANVWNLNGAPNWSGGEKFMTGDSVLFDNTGSISPAVAVTGTILPSALTVSADINYNFGGSGSLVGGMLLTKSGAGTLTLANTNTYTGGTLVNGGALAIGAGGASGSLGSGPLTNNATVIWNRSDDTTFGSAIYGSGGLLVLGSSTLTLTASNLFTGSVIISNGVLRLGHSNALGTASGSTFITNTGTLDFNAQPLFPEPLVIAGAGFNGQGALINSGAVQTNATTNVTLMADTTLGGIGRWDIRGGASTNPAVFNANDFNLTKVGNNFINIKDATGSEVGNVIINAGVLSFEGISTLNNASRNLTVNSNATLAFLNLSNTVMRDVIMNSGRLQVAGGNLSFAGAAMTLSGMNTLSNAAATWNITNAIAGSGTFSKQGPGTLNLVSSGTWSGTVTNEVGALVYYKTDALQGNIYNSGTVGFAPPSGESWTFPHLITGTGVVMQAGDGLGTTILNNALNNASGGIVVGNGALEIQAGTFSGNLLTTNGNLLIGPNVTVNANNVTVGQNIGNVFSTNLVSAGGVLNLGTGSSSELRVGYRTSDNISPVGVLDVSAMNTFTANVGNALISWCSSGTGGNLPLGYWLLATNNIISATNILVGYSSGIGTPYVPNGRIVFGSGNNIVHSPWLRVGGAKGSGGLYLTNGGSLYLSNQLNRVNFLIGNNDAGNTGTLPTNIVDFSDGLISAYLNDLILARRANGGVGCVSSYIYTSTNANNRMDVNNVTLASAEGVSSGGNKTYGLLVWSNGVMTVNSNVTLAYFNPTNGGGLVEGELRINGGLVNLHGDIVGHTNASSTSIITLDGGTLDMYPAGDTHGVGQIGYLTNPIATLNLYNGTLKNLGEYCGKAGKTLTKNGAGVLKLDGTNVYTGDTVVNGGTLQIVGLVSNAANFTVNSGTLQVDGLILNNNSNFTVNGGLLLVNGTIGTGDSVVAVNAGTLGGHGVVNGGAKATAINPGAILAPGFASTFGTLTFSNRVFMNSCTTIMKITNNLVGDKVVSSVRLILDGLLVVTNLGSTPALGDTFQLFEGNIFSTFTSYQLPVLPPELKWDVTGLDVGGNGTIKVVQNLVLPLISVGPQSQTNWVGSNVSFTVTATGIPTPSYQWFLGANSLVNETNTSLVLSNLTLSKSGLYSVLVTNIAGGTNASATLTVLFKAPAGVESVLLNGQIKFTLLADPNSIYYLRYRTNLLDGTWLDLPGSFITNNTAGAVPIELKDMAATNTLKFYRIGFLPLTP